MEYCLLTYMHLRSMIFPSCETLVIAGIASLWVQYYIVTTARAISFLKLMYCIFLSLLSTIMNTFLTSLQFTLHFKQVFSNIHNQETIIPNNSNVFINNFLIKTQVFLTLQISCPISVSPAPIPYMEHWPFWISLLHPFNFQTPNLHQIQPL
jgi:hypothetical protein